MTKTFEEVVADWREVVVLAVRQGEEKAALASAERIQSSVVAEGERLKAYLEEKTPTPMCKGTPEAVAHACPNCGCRTKRVDPDPVAVQGSDLGRPKFVCPKCSPEKCERCDGRGWNKGTTPGGARVVRVKCSECGGDGNMKYLTSM